MTFTTENILLIIPILLFLALLASKTSERLGIPFSILFIVIGILAGHDKIGGINFNNPVIAQFIGIIALNFILFSGGLDTDWKTIKPILPHGISLSTLGVIFSTFVLGILTYYLTDFTFYESLLLGAIVSSTDSASVFSVLRSRKLAIKGNIRPILELESGSNDPMAYILTIIFTALIKNQFSTFSSIINFFLLQFFLGAILGFLIGLIGKFIINKINLSYEGLYIPLVIAIMLFSYSFTQFLGGNGFLSVYLTGLYLGNQQLIHKKKILKSFDSFAWIMQIILFITLGLLVMPENISPFIFKSILISILLITIARPISVFLSLLPFRLQLRAKLFISWVGLRGAVPVVLAIFPLLEGVEKSNEIFYIVFFVSITSVLIQGTTISHVAKLLHLTVPERLKYRTNKDLEIFDYIKNSLTVITVPKDSEIVNKQVVELNLPKTSIISFIKRNGKYIIPNGNTRILSGDKLFILVENKENIKDIYETLGI